MQKDSKEEDSDLIQWHAGFCSAMYLELRDNNEDLEHITEYELNSKPLKVELLVIKKRRDVVIRNAIGKIFRTHNILEYKSPGDALNVDVYYKTIGYACLYKGYGDHVDGIPADEVTVSLVRKERPVKLIRYWREHGFQVEKAHPGVYYISNGVFPTQLIVTDELEKKEYSWLQYLTRDVNEEMFDDMYREKKTFATQREQEAALSVLDIAYAVHKEDEMGKRFSTIYKEGVQQATIATSIENAKKFLALKKLSCEEIAECTNLPLEEVRKLAEVTAK